MIKTCRCKPTLALYEGGSPKAFRAFRKAAERKLQQLDSAATRHVATRKSGRKRKNDQPTCKRAEEGRAEVILSTAHKAKGREWPTVALSSDFRKPGDELYNPEGSNLLYVAATRTRQVLGIEHCGVVPKEKKPGKVDDQKAKTTNPSSPDKDSGPEGEGPALPEVAKEA